MAIDLMKDVKKENKKPNIIFFVVFGLLILGSVAFTYYRIMIKRDYLISAEAGCDPTSEKCFVYVCDPEAGEECTGDLEEDTSYYKIIKRKAFNIPLCDPNNEDCEALICPEGEKDCSFQLCEEGNADQIECNDPEQYNIDNPEEEEAECEEGDEECLAEEALSADEEESECEEGDEECLSSEEEDLSAEEAGCDATTEDCSASEETAVDLEAESETE